jgi:hypothetical protein
LTIRQCDIRAMRVEYAADPGALPTTILPVGLSLDFGLAVRVASDARDVVGTAPGGVGAAAVAYARRGVAKSGTTLPSEFVIGLGKRAAIEAIALADETVGSADRTDASAVAEARAPARTRTGCAGFCNCCAFPGITRELVALVDWGSRSRAIRDLDAIRLRRRRARLIATSRVKEWASVAACRDA